MIRLFEIFSVLFFVLLFCGIANCDEPEDSQCLRDVSCKDNKGYDDVINYFVKVVESGNSVSRYHLSSYYFDGFVTRNDIEFCKWLQNTLERERIKSMTNLANLYYEIEDYKESAKWFEKAAKLGNSYAQYKLGLQYYEGRGVKQDKESAMYWFILAAEQGESPIIIGAVALKCIDERKFDRAERYALKAADSGLAETKLLCFTFYCGHFPEMPKNFEEAIRWCRKAVEQEYAPAQYLLGIASHLGMYGVAQDNEEAAKWFRKAAEQGDASAQGSLGALYAEGKGVKQDFKEAAKWFLKAAEQGDVQAQGALGGLYAEGKGVKKDMKEAYKWIRQSAEQGLPRSQAYLGQFYLFGFEYVTKRDPKEAAKWFEKAAMQDDAMGQRHLAILFLLGDGGLAQNNEEALKLLQKAAEKGDNVAQCFLGLMYADMLENVDTAIKSLLDESKKQDDNTIGKDWIGPASREISVPKRDFNYWLDLTSSKVPAVKKDINKAKEFLTKSAEQNNINAQFQLGRIFYLEGNHQLAVKWLQKSVEQGDKRGIMLLDLMKKTSESDKNKTKNEPPPPIPLPANFSPDDIFPKSATPSTLKPNPSDNKVFPKTNE